MFSAIVKFSIWINCKFGEHRYLPAAFSYNEHVKLYYTQSYICRDCSKILKEFGL